MLMLAGALGLGSTLDDLMPAGRLHKAYWGATVAVGSVSNFKAINAVWGKVVHFYFYISDVCFPKITGGSNYLVVLVYVNSKSKY